VKITGAASSVPDAIPDSCDSSVTESTDELALPVLSNEMILDVEAFDEILFDALSTL